MNNFQNDFGQMDPLNQHEPIDSETEPLISEEDLQYGREMIGQYHQGPGEFESEPKTPPEAQEIDMYEGYQGLPKQSDQDIVGTGTAETEPEPLEPEEVIEGWSKSESEPNFPDSIEYDNIQAINYTGQDPLVENIIEGLKSGYHDRPEADPLEERHFTMKKGEEGATGHHYPQRSAYASFDSDISSFSEPQPETDPTACETPQQLVEHHGYHPNDAELEIHHIGEYGKTISQMAANVNSILEKCGVDPEDIDFF